MVEKRTAAPILVLGATGAQGGAVARALLEQGAMVRALVRDPNSSGARRLQELGAELAVGSFTEHGSLLDACRGAVAIFSMQNAPYVDPDSERREGETMVSAARQAGISQIVHTSVSGAGAFHRSMPGFAEGHWTTNYWDSKAFVEDAVRDGEFRTWTILKPAFMMENFTRPKADTMFPDLVDDALVTAFLPETRLALVAVDDIGKAAAAAFHDSERFHGAEIELAGDHCTFPEIADRLSEATGRRIRSTSLPAAEIISRGQFPGWVRSQEWANVVGYPARTADMRAYGLEPTDFRSWAAHHAKDIATRS